MFNYLIKPLDLILFGDPSAFNATERTFRKASGLLNPIPFYGALRKIHKSAFIEFFGIVKENDFFLPLPADIVKIERRYRTGTLRKLKQTIVNASADTHHVHFDEEKIKREDGYFLKSHEFEDYLLCDKCEGFNPVTPFKTERRVGIKINRTSRTTEKEHLYFEEYIRLEDNTSFCLKTATDIAKITIPLGGESRVATIEKSDKDIAYDFVKQDKIRGEISKTGLFKLIVLTPTNALAEIEGAKLIANIAGRPFIYSGWLRSPDKSGDRGFPSRLFKLIKPGAVFYYKIEADNKDKFITALFDRFWLKASFFRPDFPYFESRDGINPLCLGLTIIGTVKEDEDE
jgi:CRISPR-associated protein Cmr3